MAESACKRARTKETDARRPDGSPILMDSKVKHEIMGVVAGFNQAKNFPPDVLATIPVENFVNVAGIQKLIVDRNAELKRVRDEELAAEKAEKDAIHAEVASFVKKRHPQKVQWVHFNYEVHKGIQNDGVGGVDAKFLLEFGIDNVTRRLAVRSRVHATLTIACEIDYEVLHAETRTNLPLNEMGSIRELIAHILAVIKVPDHMLVPLVPKSIGDWKNPEPQKWPDVGPLYADPLDVFIEYSWHVFKNPSFIAK